MIDEQLLQRRPLTEFKLSAAGMKLKTETLALASISQLSGPICLVTIGCSRQQMEICER
jgi:hypothetical protein